MEGAIWRPQVRFSLYVHHRNLTRRDRHALDFRLMTEQRIAILDSSHSLFGSSSSPTSSSSDLHSLLPIPDFEALVIDAIKSVRIKDEHVRVACIDAGVICDSSFVSGVARALHERVLKKLQDR